MTWNNSTGSLLGTISMCNNGTAQASLNVSIPEPPAASEIANGIVSTVNQSFKGIKNFADSIGLSNKVHLNYNSSSESLDFSFVV